MAEFMFNDMVAKDPLLSQTRIRAGSAGIRRNNGLSASDQTIMVMRERALNNIIRHKGREIDSQMVHDADLILNMEHEDKADIMARFPEAANQTFLLSEFAGSTGEIRDPTGGNTEMYRLCASETEGYLSAIINNLTNNLKEII